MAPRGCSWHAIKHVPLRPSLPVILGSCVLVHVSVAQQRGFWVVCWLGHNPRANILTTYLRTTWPGPGGWTFLLMRWPPSHARLALQITKVRSFPRLILVRVHGTGDRIFCCDGSAAVCSRHESSQPRPLPRTRGTLAEGLFFSPYLGND